MSTRRVATRSMAARAPPAAAAPPAPPTRSMAARAPPAAAAPPATPAPAPGFSPGQMATLQALIATSVQAAVRAVAPAASGQAESTRRPSRPAAPANTADPRVQVEESFPTGTGVCSSSSPRVPTSASLPIPVAASTVVDGLSPPIPSGVTIHSSRVPTPSPSVNISSSLRYNDFVCNPSAVNVGYRNGVTDHVPRSTYDKVLRGEYVELALFLTPLTDEPAAKRVRVSEGSGQLVLSPSLPSRRKLERLPVWLEAWSVYCALICDTQPARAVSLIRYQLCIIQAAKRYRWAAVCQYDEEFRRKLAHSPGMQWDVVDQDLYTRCFTGQALVLCPLCKRLGHTANTCTSRDQRKPGTTQPACELHNKGRCNFRNCRYRHVCSSCGAPDHVATRCGARASQ